MYTLLLMLILQPVGVQAEVQIKDHITPFLEEFRALQKPSVDQLEVLILRNEFVLSREFWAVYYNRRSEAEKRELIDRNLKSSAKELPALISVYEKKLQEILSIISATEERYAKTLNIKLQFPVYLWTALENTDGKGTEIDGVAGFSLNFRMLTDVDKNDLEILIAHEFFHVAQDLIMGGGNEETVARSLMSEGWATYVASLIVPGAKDYKYISYWLNDDTQYREYEKNRKAALAALLTDFDKTGWKSSRRYFSGDSRDSEPFPPRIGYYIGFELAKRMARTMPPMQVANMKFAKFKPLAKKNIKEMLVELK